MKNFKTILYILLFALLGGAIIVFSVLYLDNYASGAFILYDTVIMIGVLSIVTILTVLTIIFYLNEQAVVYKSMVTFLVLLLAAVAGLYFLKSSGFLDKINTVEDLRLYIEKTGNLAALTFIFIQFLQVAVIPIPGFITISAGALLFRPFYGGVLSFIGIMLGSLVAFFIGRKLGYKAASWLVGEEDLKKWLDKLKGKDKLVLTFMFLFPFFPDDILCFVAGLSTMSFTYFFIMIAVTRIISIIVTTLTINTTFIPFNTPLGIILWALIIAACVTAFYYIYKNGEKIQKYFSNLIVKRRKDKNK